MNDTPPFLALSAQPCEGTAAGESLITRAAPETTDEAPRVYPGRFVGAATMVRTSHGAEYQDHAVDVLESPLLARYASAAIGVARDESRITEARETTDEAT